MPNICVSVNLLVFITNLLVHLAEKILLLKPTKNRGDYRWFSIPFDNQASLERGNDRGNILGNKKPACFTGGLCD